MAERLIDSHAHLDYEQLAPDLPAVLDRARQSGVVGVVTVGTDAASSRRAVDLARAHPELAATAGVHPHEAAKVAPGDWGVIDALHREERVVAVGEMGLDYFYDFAPRDAQLSVFRRQLALCGATGLPAVIHVRDAFDDAFEAIEAEGLPAGGVLHCFTGGPAECERALGLGLHISLAGIVTFPKATELQRAARLVPDDRLLVETDSPYLAPVPKRGKRNEPAFVAHTARKVAELRGVDLDALAELTRRNTVRLFQLEGILPAAATGAGPAG